METRSNLRKILLPSNRGLLLDVVMFFVQLLLFYVLAGQFREVAARSIAGDVISKAGVTLFCFSLVGLSPLAAILKRYPTRLRNPNFEQEVSWLSGGLKRGAVVVYFVSQFLFWLAASLLSIELWQDYFGQTSSRTLFTPLFFGLPLMALFTTLVFIFYFLPVKRSPFLSLLATPQSELLGDVCLFLNMILFQVFWGYLMTGLTVDFKAVATRLFMFGFAALVIYFPPRLFFLAEHVHNRKVWLLMLLANAPIILRIVFAS